ncbi:MAG: DUF1328 domain-containing protein [Phycisphaeraceae bacterium]|nr:DUF1328 domain-containing protein [Phycisphaeraceae bacterium]
MLYWAVSSFILALVAAVLGFGGFAAGGTSIAKILCAVFILICLLCLALGLTRIRGRTA